MFSDTFTAPQRHHHPILSKVLGSSAPGGQGYNSNASYHGRGVDQLPPSLLNSELATGFSVAATKLTGNSLLDTRWVKPWSAGPRFIPPPMRVVDSLEHLNCLKDTLAQPGVGDKTGNEFLSYCRSMESAYRQQQAPEVLESLITDPLHDVYQELNEGMDASSFPAFIRDLLLGAPPPGNRNPVSVPC